MSDHSEPAEPDERGGLDGGGPADFGADQGGDAASGASAGQYAGAGDSGGHCSPSRRAGAPFRITIAILGPVILTTIYFTVPFDPLGPKHRWLPWLIVVGILTLLAIGMVVTTFRAMTDLDGSYRNPGLIILLLAWAATLTFSASYWAMATHEGEFVGLQTRLDALYFTGVTMATVGYGDIHPSGQLGRAVVLVQLLYTFTFLAAGLAAVRTRTRARLARRGAGRRA